MIVENETETVDTETDVVDAGTPADADNDTTLLTPGDAEDGTDAPDEGDAEKADGDVAEGEGAPEEYADFVAPEGIELNAEALSKFVEVARAKNMTQEEAQGLVDIATEIMAQQQSAVAEQIMAVRQQWVDATKADTEIGGDKLDATLAVALGALDRFGNDALRSLLNESGLGNHPEVIRFCAAVGKATAEDTFVAGGNATNAPKSAASILYPNHPNKE